MNVRMAATLFVLLFVMFCLCSACRKSESLQSTAREDAARVKLRSFWQLYGEATQLRTAGKLRQAAGRYEEALKLDPAHEDCLYYLASSLAELGDYPKAVQLYEALVRQNPDSHRGHFQLGVALSTPRPGARLDFPRARQAFLRNVEINREESGPFLRLGELALYEGKTAEARRHFDTAAGFQSPEGMFRAGFVRYVQGEYSSALRLFLKVLDVNAHERKISGRGVRSEGDIQATAGRFTPLERAGIQALVYLYWTSRRAGGYPSDIAEERRIKPPKPGNGLAFVPLAAGAGHGPSPPVPSVRDFWKEDWGPATGAEVSRYFDSRVGDSGTIARVEAENPPRDIRILFKQGSSVTIGDALHPVVDLEVFDFDRDGNPDILALPFKAGLRLYHGRGDGAFDDVTPSSGLPEDETEAYAVAAFDYDRDGLPDILLAPYPPYVQVLQGLAHPPAGESSHSLRLFRNSGNGRFQEVHGMPGLAEVHGVVSAAPADFDGDGFQDLFLACGGLDSFRLEPSVVLRNEKGKSFSVAAYLPGFDNPVRALGGAVRDLDGDGRPDICLRTAQGISLFRNVRARQ